MGYDEYTDFDYDQAAERREYEDYLEVAGHNDDARANRDCLMLAVDYLTTRRQLSEAYAAKDTETWVALTEHMQRVKYSIDQWQGLWACIDRGDYGV